MTCTYFKYFLELLIPTRHFYQYVELLLSTRQFRYAVKLLKYQLRSLLLCSNLYINGLYNPI